MGEVRGQDHHRIDLVPGQQLLNGVDDRDVLAERFPGVRLPPPSGIGHHGDRRPLPGVVGVGGQVVAGTETDDTDPEVFHEVPS